MLNNRWEAYVEENVIDIYIYIRQADFSESLDALLAYVWETGKVTLPDDCVSTFIRNNPVRP